jgi:hypothetical protein
MTDSCSGRASSCKSIGHFTKSIDARSVATTASGNETTASGYETSASGYETTASGYETTASGYETTASGYETTASGYETTASGYETTARSNETSAFMSSKLVARSIITIHLLYGRKRNAFIARPSGPRKVFSRSHTGVCTQRIARGHAHVLKLFPLLAFFLHANHHVNWFGACVTQIDHIAVFPTGALRAVFAPSRAVFLHALAVIGLWLVAVGWCSPHTRNCETDNDN